MVEKKGCLRVFGLACCNIVMVERVEEGHLN
jgi:hypothetical protein